MTDRATIERIYGPWDESNAINAASDKQCTWLMMVGFYRDCLKAYGQGVQINWLKVNAAIMARWPKGLLRIKTKAWVGLTLRELRAASGKIAK